MILLQLCFHSLNTFMMKNVILILLLFCISCDKQEYSLLVLPDETLIKGIDYPNEIVMNYPLCIEVINNKLFLLMYKGEDVIKIVDADNGSEIKNIGKFGNAPGDFLQPCYWGIDKNKNILIYDLGLKKLRKYNWNDILNTSKLLTDKQLPLKNTEIHISEGKIFNNNSFVCSTPFGTSNPITIFDNNLSIIESLGEVPTHEHKSTNLISYIGNTNTYGDKFVFVMASLGYIAYYQQKKEGCELLWDHYIERPIYKGDQLDRKQLKLGFPDVKITKNYIFCSYFGERLTREKLKTLKVRNILVFDHKGNLLKNLRSERSVGIIAISEDEKTLYAVTEEPEIAIIRFDISNLFN